MGRACEWGHLQIDIALLRHVSLRVHGPGRLPSCSPLVLVRRNHFSDWVCSLCFLCDKGGNRHTTEGTGDAERQAQVKRGHKDADWLPGSPLTCTKEDFPQRTYQPQRCVAYGGVPIWVPCCADHYSTLTRVLPMILRADIERKNHGRYGVFYNHLEAI